MPKLMVVTLLPLTLLGMVSCKKNQAAAPAFGPQPVVAVELKPQEVTLYDEFNGRVQAVDAVEIKSRAAGYIQETNFKEGSLVKKGDLLYRIDPRPYQAELSRAEAELARAQSQSELARVQAERVENLVSTHAVSKEERDRRVAELQQAKANELSAGASVDQAKLSLEYTEIKSPIDGRVGQIQVTSGNLIEAGGESPVLTSVVSTNPVYIYFNCDEQSFLRMMQLMSNARETGSRTKIPVKAQLADETGFPREGYLDFVGNRLDEASGTIRLRAIIDNTDQRLVPGLFAKIKISPETVKDALLVNGKSVMTDQNRSYVYVVGRGNVAERRDVELGRSIEGNRMVKSGLKSGDQVVGEGAQKIFFPGMPIQPTAPGVAEIPNAEASR